MTQTEKLREKIKEIEFKVPVPMDNGEMEARYIHLEDRGIDQILAKAREAVKGAGLTDDEIKRNFRASWEKRNTEDLTLEEDEECLEVMKEQLQAQTQAILKALGGE